MHESSKMEVLLWIDVKAAGFFQVSPSNKRHVTNLKILLTRFRELNCPVLQLLQSGLDLTKRKSESANPSFRSGQSPGKWLTCATVARSGKNGETYNQSARSTRHIRILRSSPGNPARLQRKGLRWPTQVQIFSREITDFGSLGMWFLRDLKITVRARIESTRCN